MMKWKVTRGPRCASADRSSDYLRKVQELPDPNRIRSTFTNNDSSGCSKSNGQQQQENGEKDVVPLSENRKRTQNQESNRKSSFVSTDCINLKGIFGLSRDRNDTPYSSLSVLDNGTRRRSRSEARGTSIDRLTLAYHAAPLIGPQHYIHQNGACKSSASKKPRSSSPGEKSGCWVRGRRRERESYVLSKEAATSSKNCRTVVTESKRKSATSKKVPNGRTITDSSCGNDHENRERKPSVPVSTENDIMTRGKENVEINNNDDRQETSLKTDIASGDVTDMPKTENKPRRNRKKRLAPKPQKVSFVEDDKSATNDEVGPRDISDPPKVSDLVATVAGEEQMASIDSVLDLEREEARANEAEVYIELETFKESTVSVFAEIHNDVESVKDSIIVHCEEEEFQTDKNNAQRSTADSSAARQDEADARAKENADVEKGVDSSSICNGVDESFKDEVTEVLCLERVYGEKEVRFEENGGEDMPSLAPLAEENDTHPLQVNSVDNTDSGNPKDSDVNEENTLEEVSEIKELSLTHVLKADDSPEIANGECSKGELANHATTENRPSSVTNSCSCASDCNEETKTDVEETYLDAMDSVCGELCTCLSRNDASSDAAESVSVQKSSEPQSETHSPEPPPRKKTLNNQSMRVNVVVKNPQDSSSEDKDVSAGFVVKKSFVLTVAKQEEGFRSLCARKDVPSNQEPENKTGQQQQQISVTFLCAAPAPGTFANAQINNVRLRSLSVPPNGGIAESIVTVPNHRSFSKERRPKDRQSSKRKSHRSRKKDNPFNMPQAVIDELSQVLEHRKRVPDAEAC